MEKVVFKSNNVFFMKEFDNLNNNTVREVDKNDNRFDILKNFYDKELKDLTIKIMNSEEPLAYFERIVKDVSFYKNLCIITWYVYKNYYFIVVVILYKY